MREQTTLEPTEAVQRITQKVLLLESQRELNNDLLAFYVEKLVSDILDYCRRNDFPEGLVYTAVDLIRKRLADEAEAAGNAEELGMSIKGPLSAVKMDDTEFKFAVKSADLSGCLSDLDLESIKPKLRLYRKLVSLP